MPANTPVWKGLAAGTLTETPESGKVTFGERIGYVQQFAGRYNDAVTFASAHFRGSQWVVTIGLMSAVVFVNDATVTHDKGGRALVTVNYDAATFTGGTGTGLPPDEFALTPIELNPALERNDYFATLTQDEIKKARASYNSATESGGTGVDSTITTLARSALIQSLIAKWTRGTDSFYMAGMSFQHTMYFSYAPNGYRGGVLQQPYGAFAGYVSGAGLQWLRRADEVVWSNGLWKLMRTWIGGPNGYWDTDLYPTST